jgi:hypothetical protein
MPITDRTLRDRITRNDLWSRSWGVGDADSYFGEEIDLIKNDFKYNK